MHVHPSKCWRGTCLSVEMQERYMLICQDAEGVHGKQKVGNPWYNRKHPSRSISAQRWELKLQESQSFIIENQYLLKSAWPDVVIHEIVLKRSAIGRNWWWGQGGQQSSTGPWQNLQVRKQQNNILLFLLWVESAVCVSASSTAVTKLRPAGQIRPEKPFIRPENAFCQ